MLQPVQLLNDEATEEKGSNARLSSFVGALAITDLVKTTLGPKGMDKILQSMGHEHEISVTNDGATILKAIHLDNPAAKVLVDISKTQDDEVGDGTTSVCVLAGELLREAERLCQQKVHPQTIIQGYRMAVDIAYKALEEISSDPTSEDVLRSNLINIARTTLNSKILRIKGEHFAKIAVDAVLRLKGNTSLDCIHIIKKTGGSLNDSFLDEGFILEKRFGVGQSKRVVNPKILVANTSMDYDKIKIFGAKVKVDGTEKLSQIEEIERQRMMTKCQKIIDHKCDIFINRQLIYNVPEQYFSDHGIVSIEHADFEGVERLALVLGAEIVSTFDNPENVKLGTCAVVEEIMIGEDKMIKFSGVSLGEACTIVLRGSSEHILAEAERSLHDALCVLSQMVAKDRRTVLGGGVAEMHMAHAVDELARRTPGKKALALESFAKALRMIPTIICENGGYDSSDIVTRLRAAHSKGESSLGLDMINGGIMDISTTNILESFKVKSQVLLSATEACEMILRVDDIIKTAPRKRQPGPGGY